MHFAKEATKRDFFDSHEKRENASCDDQCLTGRPAGRLAGVARKNFNIAIFSDTMNNVNVKPCIVVVLTEFYPFILPSVTLIVFQSHSSVKQFQLKMLRSLFD